MADVNSQFTIDEDQEMETQPIYLSSDESEIVSPCSSPIPQLPNNVPDTYSAITQLKATQHEQMSSSGNFALQYPTTPSASLISDDDTDEVPIPIIGNPAQLLPYTPNRHPHPLQLCQQITPIPDTLESSTTRKSWAIGHFPSLRNSQATVINVIQQPPPPQYHDSGKWIAKFDIARPSGTQ